MAYREFNKTDQIEVFSKEPHIFYNRVLLPEYTNSELKWPALKKISQRQLQELNILVHTNCTIEDINRTRRNITDNSGKSYQYDKLILATGSRPFLPPEVPIRLNGIFTIRDRSNADNLKKHLEELEKETHDISEKAAQERDRC